MSTSPNLTYTSALALEAAQDHELDTDLLPLFLLRFDAANTRRAYANDLRQFFQSESITLRLARAVDFRLVNEHLAELGSSGAKPTTIQRRIAALRGFFAWLIALGVLHQNPADRHLVRRIRSTTRQDHALTVLTREQAKLLLDAVNPDLPSAVRDRTLITVLLYCVLRRSEAQAMDFDHLRQVGSYWVLDLPVAKGGTDQYVKVTDRVAETIFDYKAHYGYDNGAVWRSMSNNTKGRRLSANSIYNIVKTHACKAGLSGSIGAHTLRHTGCTLAIESGASIQQVQAHARHKNLETTMIYVHQRDRLRDSAADYIDL